MNPANHRIARNTIYMYVRLVTTMVISLYISRLSLEILGVSSYGLFAVVGGVLAMFTFISTSLASATSRFFNTEMGKTNGDLNACFNINLLLHVCLAVIIFILAESIGLWYIYHYLNVADGKIGDAVFVYQVSIFTACLGIVNTPYQSLITAHEKFNFMAVLDIFNSVVRLAGILMLSLLPSEGWIIHLSFLSDTEIRYSSLRLYALVFALTTVTSFVVYHWEAYHRWHDIIKFRFVRGRKRYQDVLVFNNWNLLATMAYMANSSGTDLLFNMFFGTSVNGAFAVSKSVKQGIVSFTGNFDSASAPQIIQSYAANDKNRYTFLCNKIGKINLLAFELICFPLLIQLNYVLHLWLGKVPDGAYTLTFLCIIQGGVALTCGGIYNLINASGRIKWFKISVSFFFLLCLPIGYVMFKLGFPPYSLLVLFVVADIMQRIVQLVLLHVILGFDSWKYARKAYVRPMMIACIETIGILGFLQFGVASTVGRVVSIVICAILTFLLVVFVGLNKNERMGVLEMLKGRL